VTTSDLLESISRPPEPWRGSANLCRLFDDLVTRTLGAQAATVLRLVSAAPPPTPETRAKLAELLS
jgi:hypothetical protein